MTVSIPPPVRVPRFLDPLRTDPAIDSHFTFSSDVIFGCLLGMHGRGGGRHESVVFKDAEKKVIQHLRSVQ